MVWTILIALTVAVCAAKDLKLLKNTDEYTEELLIKRLSSDNPLSQFRFVIGTDSTLDHDYKFFPRIIAELLRKHHVQEFHLSLTQGFWRTSDWGIAPQPAVPSGAQLYAWFGGDKHSVDERWNNLVNSLNGIFCASLLQMIPTYATAPELSFRPSGFVEKNGSDYIRYAALSGETVCTENLTPWRKLLPCKQTGLSTLINPIKLYESVFHSMSMHVTHICANNAVGCGDRIRLELNLNLVSELNLRTRSLDFSVRDIFGRRIDQKCEISDSSVVILEVDGQMKNYNSGGLIQKYDGRTYSIYNISSLEPSAFPIDVFAKYKTQLSSSKKFSDGLINVHSYLSGTNQQSGKVVTWLTNLQSVEQQLIYTHMLPWFIRVYYHSMQLRCESEVGKQKEWISGKVLRKSFKAAKDRQQPFLIEWDMLLPPNSLCEFSFEFDKAFLRVNEYPPDANHGSYIPAAVITLFEIGDSWHTNRTAIGGAITTAFDELMGTRTSRKIMIFGEALLVLLPVPDFSMPFNVICLVSTAIAMLFGPVHTLTTKIMIPLMKEDEDLAPKPPLRRFIIFLRLFLVKRFPFSRFFTQNSDNKMKEKVS